MSDAKCYTTSQVCEKLAIPRSSFFTMKRQGRLPMLEEIQPRLGRLVRYRADLVDRYLSNQWLGRKFFRKAS